MIGSGLSTRVEQREYWMEQCPNCRVEVGPEARFCPECGTKLLADVERTDSMLGRTLNDKYRVHSLIGSGSMGTVYRGEHIGLRKKVALKILHPNLQLGKEDLHRFQREGIAAGQFTHPNAIQIFDFDQAGEHTFYLAMEFVEGETLRAHLAEQGPLSPAEGVAIMRQVLSALGEAHRNGIVHRDLKPDNIMVIKSASGSLTVKVLDFGMSKLVDRPMEMSLQTVPGRIIGTPLYMAPEQATGGEVDQRADLYAAGLVLFELLTGSRPFQGNSITELFIKQASEPVPSLTRSYAHLGVTPALDDVIGRSLEKLSDDRFQSAAEMLEALDGCLDPEAAGQPRRRRKPARRPPRMTKRRTTYLAAGVVLISTLAGAAWHFSTTGPPPPRVSMKSPEAWTDVEARYAGELLAARASLLADDAEVALAHIGQAHLMPCRDSEAYLLRAEIHRRMEDDEIALADYREALSLDPHYTAAASGVGWIQMARGQLNEALETFEGAARRDPQAAEPLAGQGAAQFLLGDAQTAHTLLIQAIATDVNCTPAHEWLGRWQLAQGEAGRAVESFVLAKRGNARSWRAFAGLGAAYLLQERYTEAERQLRGALTLAPHATEARADLAALMLETGRAAEVLTLVGPDEVSASGRLAALKGAALYAAGRSEDASVALEAAVASGKADASTHTLLGIIYHGQGKADEAVPQYQAAIAIDSNVAIPHKNLGLLFFELGRYEDAEHELMEAHLLDSEDATTHFGLGVLFKDYLLDASRAADHFELYVELGGEDERALEWANALRRR
jgi:serine/threonine protein kinase/Flp pilus assembly protein TadD